MQQAVYPSDAPLPLGTAALSNIALALLMWNLVVRLALFLTG